MLMRLSALSCGVGAALLLAPATAMPAEPAPEKPPEAVAVYIRSCATAIYDLMGRADKKDLPKSCEDERLRVLKPGEVTRSVVWIWRDRVSLDAMLADQRRVRFDDDRMMVLPRMPADEPNKRPVQGCTTYGGFGGGSQCCTMSGFCCTWVYDRLGSCGYM